MIGQMVGNYQIREKIGEGGMGTVYKGVDLMLEREVALKALRPELGRMPQLVERFRAEAVTLARLNHPNIATLYSFLRQGDEFWMAMEFVRGETLEVLLRRKGALPPAPAVRFFSQALAGIAHAHQLGIVHRDLKPANLMLSDQGSVKVMDFGIARALGSARMTQTGRLIGTLAYMSPEQIHGQEADGRSDIYALGIVLYEMVTGRVPFASDSEFEVMRAHIELPPPPPTRLMAQVPDSLERAILRALAKQPGDRFQTALEFCDALSEVLPATGAAFNTAERQALVIPPATRSAGDQIIKETRLAGSGEHPSSAPSGAAAAARSRRLAPLDVTFTWKHYTVLAAAMLALLSLWFATAKRQPGPPATPPPALPQAAPPGHEAGAPTALAPTLGATPLAPAISGSAAEVQPTEPLVASEQPLAAPVKTPRPARTRQPMSRPAAPPRQPVVTPPPPPVKVYTPPPPPVRVYTPPPPTPAPPREEKAEGGGKKKEKKDKEEKIDKAGRIIKDISCILRRC